MKAPTKAASQPIVIVLTSFLLALPGSAAQEILIESTSGAVVMRDLNGPEDVYLPYNFPGEVLPRTREDDDTLIITIAGDLDLAAGDVLRGIGKFPVKIFVGNDVNIPAGATIDFSAIDANPGAGGGAPRGGGDGGLGGRGGAGGLAGTGGRQGSGGLIYTPSSPVPLSITTPGVGAKNGTGGQDGRQGGTGKAGKRGYEGSPGFGTDPDAIAEGGTPPLAVPSTLDPGSGGAAGPAAGWPPKIFYSAEWIREALYGEAFREEEDFREGFYDGGGGGNAGHGGDHPPIDPEGAHPGLGKDGSGGRNMAAPWALSAGGSGGSGSGGSGGPGGPGGGGGGGGSGGQGEWAEPIPTGEVEVAGEVLDQGYQQLLQAAVNKLLKKRGILLTFDIFKTPTIDYGATGGRGGRGGDGHDGFDGGAGGRGGDAGAGGGALQIVAQGRIVFDGTLKVEGSDGVSGESGGNADNLLLFGRLGEFGSSPFPGFGMSYILNFFGTLGQLLQDPGAGFGGRGGEGGVGGDGSDGFPGGDGGGGAGGTVIISGSSVEGSGNLSIKGGNSDDENVSRRGDNGRVFLASNVVQPGTPTDTALAAEGFTIDGTNLASTTQAGPTAQNPFIAGAPPTPIIGGLPGGAEAFGFLDENAVSLTVNGSTLISKSPSGSEDPVICAYRADTLDPNASQFPGVFPEDYPGYDFVFVFSAGTDLLTNVRFGANSNFADLTGTPIPDPNSNPALGDIAMALAPSHSASARIGGAVNDPNFGGINDVVIDSFSAFQVFVFLVPEDVPAIDVLNPGQVLNFALTADSGGETFRIEVDKFENGDVLCASSNPDIAVYDADWLGVSLDSNWSDTTNWSIPGWVPPGLIPFYPNNNATAAFNVSISQSNAEVYQDVTVTIDRLFIDSNNTLQINPGNTMVLEKFDVRANAGTIDNSGVIMLGGDVGGAGLTALLFSGSELLLTGPGELTTYDGTDYLIGGLRQSDSLINDTNHTITAAGNLGGSSLSITNRGTIRSQEAEVSWEGGLLTIDPSGDSDRPFPSFVNEGSVVVNENEYSRLRLYDGFFHNKPGGIVGFEPGGLEQILTFEDVRYLGHGETLAGSDSGFVQFLEFTGDTSLEQVNLQSNGRSVIFFNNGNLNLGGATVTNRGTDNFGGLESEVLLEYFDYPIHAHHVFIRGGTFDFAGDPGLATCSNPGGSVDTFETWFRDGHSGLEDITLTGNYCFDRRDEISAQIGGPYSPVVGYDHTTFRVSNSSLTLAGNITNDGLFLFDDEGNQGQSVPPVDVPIRGAVNLNGSGAWRTGSHPYQFIADSTTAVDRLEIGSDQVLLDPVFFTSPLGSGESSLIVDNAAGLHGASFLYDDSVLESPLDKDATLAAVKEPLILINSGIIEPNGSFGGGTVDNIEGTINLGEVSGEFDATFENVRILGGEVSLHHYKEGGWATTTLNSPVTGAFNTDFEEVLFRSPVFQPAADDLSNIPDLAGNFGDVGLIATSAVPLQRGAIDCDATPVEFIDVSLATHLYCDNAALSGSLTIAPGVLALFSDVEIGDDLAIFADSSSILNIGGSLTLAEGAPLDTLLVLPAGLDIRATGEIGGNELFIRNETTLDLGLDARFTGPDINMVIDPAGDMNSPEAGFVNRGIIRSTLEGFFPDPSPAIYLTDGYYDNEDGTIIFSETGTHRIENSLVEGGVLQPLEFNSEANVDVDNAVLKDLTIASGVQLSGDAILDNVTYFNSSQFGGYTEAGGTFTIRGDLRLDSNGEPMTTFAFGAPPTVESPATDRIIVDANAVVQLAMAGEFQSLVNEGYIESLEQITFTTPLRPTGQILGLDTLVADPDAPLGTLTTLEDLDVSAAIDVEVAGLIRNSGTILANPVLLIDQAVVDNTGALEASNEIHIYDSLIRNEGGRIGNSFADAVTMYNTTIQGGVVNESDITMTDGRPPENVSYGTESITTFIDVSFPTTGSFQIFGPLVSCIGLIDVASGAVTNTGELLISGVDSRFDCFEIQNGGFAPGTISVNEGTLRAEDPIDNQSNGTIRGTGIIEGSCSNNGRIAPGFSVGQLEFTDDLVLNPTSVLAIEIGAEGADLISVTGTSPTTFAGALEIATLEGANVCRDDLFTVFTSNEPLTGSFGGGSYESGDHVPTTSGGSFQIFYGTGSPHDPNSLVLTNYVANSAPFTMTPLTGTIDVIQNDAGNNTTSVTLALSPASLGSINPAVQSRGDFPLTFGTGNDPANGVLISSTAQLGRNNGDSLGFFRYTTSTWIGGGYFVAAAPAPTGGEANGDVSYGWFPYDEWLGAFTSNPSNGAPFTVLHGSPGIDNTVIVDNGSGLSTVNLQGIDPEATGENGILLVNSAENEDNFALSRANPDGTFTIFNKDNGVNADTGEPDSVAFVYVPTDAVDDTSLVAMGRVIGDTTGGSLKPGITNLQAGNFSLSKAAPFEAQWYLTIPGHGPESGNLIISPAMDGNSLDNIVSYEWQPAQNRWLIESRDLIGVGLQDVPGQAAFSFAFFTTLPPVVVTTTDDELDAVSTEGDGVSLREAIRDAAPGTTIGFDASLLCGPINLDLGTLVVDKKLTIDSTNVLGGMTISGIDTHRIFEVTSTGELILEGLTLTDGFRPNGTGNFGGAVENDGTLVIRDCTIKDCQAHIGGGIYSFPVRSTTVERCTFVNNKATGFGGGALGCGTSAPITISNSTFVWNTGQVRGGALYLVQGRSEINHSTFVDNYAPSGGAITQTFNTLTLGNCLVVGNSSDGVGPDIENGGTSVGNGVNIISNLTNSGFVAGPTVIVDSPFLLPLGDYGGATMTTPPVPGSSPVDGGLAILHHSGDQRGIERDASPDVGAVEFQGASDLVGLWETDLDGDGLAFGLEQALGMNPFASDRGSPRELAVTGVGGGQINLSFGYNPASAPHTIWIVKRSTDLENFVEVFRFDGTTANATESLGISATQNPDSFDLIDSFDADASRVFYRFESILVTE